MKAAKAFSKGQFAKNCLMLAEKIEIVPLTNVNETDVNIVGKFEINTVQGCRKRGAGGTLCSNGNYVDISNQHQVQQNKSCLK